MYVFSISAESPFISFNLVRVPGSLPWSPYYLVLEKIRTKNVQTNIGIE